MQVKRKKFNFNHKCEICWEGYISPMLSSSPRTPSSSSSSTVPSRATMEHWKCSHCEYSLPADIFKMKNKVISGRIDAQKDNWESLWMLLYDYDYILHPYHLYVYRILGHIVTLGWEMIQTSRIDIIQYKFLLSMLTITDRVLEILNYIYPDNPKTKDIGRVLYLKQMLLGFKFIRDAESYRCLIHLYDCIEYMDIPGRLCEIKAVQEECYEILRTEPKGTKLNEMANKLNSVIFDQDFVLALLLPERHYESRTIDEFTRIYSRFCSAEYETQYTNEFDFGIESLITGGVPSSSSNSSFSC